MDVFTRLLVVISVCPTALTRTKNQTLCHFKTIRSHVSKLHCINIHCKWGQNVSYMLNYRWLRVGSGIKNKKKPERHMWVWMATAHTKAAREGDCADLLLAPFVPGRVNISDMFTNYFRSKYRELKWWHGYINLCVYKSEKMWKRRSKYSKPTLEAGIGTNQVPVFSNRLPMLPLSLDVTEWRIGEPS